MAGLTDGFLGWKSIFWKYFVKSFGISELWKCIMFLKYKSTSEISNLG